MGVQFKELRRVCQLPVADGNDVAGLLFGDKASLPLTKLLVDLNLSPSVATVGMLVCGLAGSALQFGTPWMVVGGALLLLLYYVLDCVDGEVARWKRIEHARWGYYEYIFHFVVKPVCFLSVGFATWRELAQIELLLAGMAAAVATLWLKLFLGLPSIVFVGTVFGRRFSGDRPYQEYLAEAQARLRERDGVPATREVFRLRFDLTTLRSLGTNFDIGLLLLLVASLVDVFVQPFALPGLDVGLVTARALWLAYYGLVLPLDFLDYVRTYFRQGHFDRQMVRLLAGAHGFTLPGLQPLDERSESAGPGAPGVSAGAPAVAAAGTGSGGGAGRGGATSGASTPPLQRAGG